MDQEPWCRYLVELYLPRTSSDEPSRTAERLGAAAADLTREGTPVRYLRTIFVPDDETCFHLFEATSADAVAAAGKRAALSFGRIAAAVELEANSEHGRPS